MANINGFRAVQAGNINPATIPPDVCLFGSGLLDLIAVAKRKTGNRLTFIARWQLGISAMRTHTLFFTLLLAATMTVTPGQSLAENIRVAVASNFMAAMASIARQFETGTDYTVTLSPGSTGKNYAQIRNGAPFDIFFAADTRRPELLQKLGVALPGSLLTYAVGSTAPACPLHR